MQHKTHRTRYFLITCFFGLACVHAAQAQYAPVEWSHRLLPGVAFSRTSDKFLNLSNAGITSFSLQYDYSKLRAARVQVFSFEWNTGASTAVKTNSFRLSYSDGFSVTGNKHSPLRVYLGYRVETTPVYLQTHSLSYKTYSWANTTDLAAYSNIIYSRGHNRWWLDVGVPLLGFASRPGETDDDATDGNVNRLLYDSYANTFFTSPHNLLAADASIGYERSINSSWALQCALDYHYKQIDNDYSFTSQLATARAGVVFYLK